MPVRKKWRSRVSERSSSQRFFGGMESGEIQSIYWFTKLWTKIGLKCFKNNKNINLWTPNVQNFRLRRAKIKSQKRKTWFWVPPVKNGGMENHEKKTLTHPEELQQPQERQRKGLRREIQLPEIRGTKLILLPRSSYDKINKYHKWFKCENPFLPKNTLALCCPRAP